MSVAMTWHKECHLTTESFNPCDVYLPGAEYFNGRCFLYVQTRMYQDQAQVMFIIYYTKNTSEEYFVSITTGSNCHFFYLEKRENRTSFTLLKRKEVLCS